MLSLLINSIPTTPNGHRIKYHRSPSDDRNLLTQKRKRSFIPEIAFAASTFYRNLHHLLFTIPRKPCYYAKLDFIQTFQPISMYSEISGSYY